MDAFLHLMESNGVTVTASQAATLTRAYTNATDDSHLQNLKRSIDELPLIWRANYIHSSCDASTAKSVLLGLLELAHSSTLASRLEALESIKISSTVIGLEKKQREALADDNAEETANVEREYREALECFAEQVRSLHSRLQLQCGGAPPPQLLCSRPVDSLTEAESALDTALVGLADRLFNNANRSTQENDEPAELGQDDSDFEWLTELQRVRHLHRRVLVERGRLAGRSAQLAEQIRRLRAHLDDPERTLSMAKTWLLEAKKQSEHSLAANSDAPDSTTLESAAATAASVLAGQQEQRRLDRRLAGLKQLADKQARLLDLLQRRRQLHEQLLNGQEAELAKLRRLRSLVESGRRQIAEDRLEAHQVSKDAIVLVDADESRLSSYLDRLSRLRARLEMDSSIVGSVKSEPRMASSPKDLIELTEQALAAAKDLLAESEQAWDSNSANPNRQRLAELNSRLTQVKQKWVASHSGSK